MTDNHYDLLVIGAGSGGIAAARRAASYNKSVVIVEQRELGGTCVNRGCVPKKVGFNLVQMKEFFKLSNSYGLSTEDSLDYERFKIARDKYIQRLQNIYANNIANSNVKVITGKASFLSHDTVDVNGQTYSANNVLIAVGGAPKRPTFEGAELIENSDDFFSWDSLPRSVALIGSGYIACELSSQLNGLGVETSLIFRKNSILSSFPAFLGETLKDDMDKNGIHLIAGKSPSKAIRQGKLIEIFDSSNETMGSFEKVIWAAGRYPLTESLGLNKAGLNPDAAGFINVDSFQQSSVPNLYAVGDVTGIGMLTPYAINRGRALADWLFGEKEMVPVPRNVPTVIFSHPPIASVGLSEEQAKETSKGKPVKVYDSEFKNMLYALSDRKPLSKFQIVVSGKEETVVGIHMIGYGSDEILQGFAAAMSAGATKTHFDQTLAIHPTAAEEMVLML
jgi:glutathione reductase (NADPH)